MDKWKEFELAKMKVGGNRKAKEFLNSQADWNPNATMVDKYNSRAAALYREKVCLSLGFETPMLSNHFCRLWLKPKVNGGRSRLRLPPNTFQRLCHQHRHQVTMVRRIMLIIPVVSMKTNGMPAVIKGNCPAINKCFFLNKFSFQWKLQ